MHTSKSIIFLLILGENEPRQCFAIPMGKPSWLPRYFAPRNFFEIQSQNLRILLFDPFRCECPYELFVAGHIGRHKALTQSEHIQSLAIYPFFNFPLLQGAPDVVLDLCHNKDDIHDQVFAKVETFKDANLLFDKLDKSLHLFFKQSCDPRLKTWEPEEFDLLQLLDR